MDDNFGQNPKIRKLAVFVTVGLIFFLLGLARLTILKNLSQRSRAAVETAKLFFEPNNIQGTAVDSEFTANLKLNLTTPKALQLFKTVITFDRTKIQVKDNGISYLVGTPSINLDADSNDTLTRINEEGKIVIIGERLGESLVMPVGNHNLVSITFKSLADTGSRLVVQTASSYLKTIKEDFSINTIGIDSTPVIFYVNETPPTPTINPSISPLPATGTLPSSTPIVLPSPTPVMPAIATVTPGGLTLTPTPITVTWTVSPTPVVLPSPTPVMPAVATVTPGGPTLTPTPITVTWTVSPTSIWVTPTPQTVTIVPTLWWPTATPIMVTSGPVPTSVPTQITSGNVNLYLKLRFQGVMAQPAASFNNIEVRVKLGNNNTGNQTEYQKAGFVSDGSGIWTNSTPLVFNVPLNSNYKIYVKGPKQLQKKICDLTPTETAPGTYHCENGRITLKNGVNNLDFSNVYQLVGDLPEQNGVVDSYDISLIRNNLNRTDYNILSIADVNFDGRVDSQDYSLLIAALSIRFDDGE